MSFLKKVIKKEQVKPAKEIKPTNDIFTASSIGTVVFYNTRTNEFMLSSSEDFTKVNIDGLQESDIMIGTVIAQHEDMSVDALMCGFIMKEPVYQYMPTGGHPTKAQYVNMCRAHANDVFRQYKEAFFRKCPEYEELLKLSITMPTIGELLFIQNNKDEFFSTLSQYADMKNYDEYIHRLFNTYIYAKNENKLYMILISPDTRKWKEKIILPNGTPGNIMCVFRNIKLI